MRKELSPKQRAARLGSLVVLLSAALNIACMRSPEDYLRRARDAMYARDPLRAVESYQKALELAAENDSPKSRTVRALALREAADAYYLELREPRRAAELYRALVLCYPDAPETLSARLSLAQILRVHYRDLRGAIAELAGAIAREPPQSAQLRYEMAKLYFELGDYPQCQLESDAIVRKYGASGIVDRAIFLKAEALSMIEGRSSEAIRALEELVERFPDSELHPHALYELGRMRADAGDLEAAIEQWVKALKSHPTPSFVQSAISRARKRLEQVSRGGDRLAAAVFGNRLFDGISGVHRARSRQAP